MSQFVFKMPDLGEGTVEAEIVAWHIKPGDVVQEDQVIVEVMTDKAAVEVPAPVSGRVVTVSGEPGERIAVGAPLIVFDTTPQTQTQAARSATVQPAAVPIAPAPAPTAGIATIHEAAVAAPPPAAHTAASVAPTTRVMTSPANRRRAREAGIDLHTVSGSGPGGRIVARDLNASAADSAVPTAAVAATDTARAAALGEVTEIKVIGVRRVIAERMSESKRTIPHFAYVEEVDVTELESLRVHLNEKRAPDSPALTYLPLVIMALVRALETFPQCNALFDAARGVVMRHRAVHVGIATQTGDGLKVPVVRNAQVLSLNALAGAIRQVSERARSGSSTREELTGSTITVTSLGKLGGIASTPVINAPEVSIIGLNKAVDRPVVSGGAVTVRRIMNLSSSFDHRFVDGYDAAGMIQSLKELLEHPAMIFIPR